MKYISGAREHISRGSGYQNKSKKNISNPAPTTAQPGIINNRYHLLKASYAPPA
jgi:hypothetical protein